MPRMGEAICSCPSDFRKHLEKCFPLWYLMPWDSSRWISCSDGCSGWPALLAGPTEPLGCHLCPYLQLAVSASVLHGRELCIPRWPCRPEPGEMDIARLVQSGSQGQQRWCALPRSLPWLGVCTPCLTYSLRCFVSGNWWIRRSGDVGSRGCARAGPVPGAEPSWQGGGSGTAQPCQLQLSQHKLNK